MFRVLLRFLYTHKLPVEEDCGEGLEVGEMVQVAFQAVALYKHCVEQFKEGLAVDKVGTRCKRRTAARHSQSARVHTDFWC